jgi:hypothetical protein
MSLRDWVILFYWQIFNKIGKNTERRLLPPPWFCLQFCTTPTLTSENMIQTNSSRRDYEENEGVELGSDRLPVGPALFTVFGLSLLAWAVVLAPIIAILHY